jgi:hypothetical protein
MLLFDILVGLAHPPYIHRVLGPANVVLDVLWGMVNLPTIWYCLTAFCTNSSMLKRELIGSQLG